MDKGKNSTAEKTIFAISNEGSSTKHSANFISESVSEDESSSGEIEKSSTKSSKFSKSKTATSRINRTKNPISQKFIESSSNSSSSCDENAENRLPTNLSNIIEKQKKVVGRRRAITDSSSSEEDGPSNQPTQHSVDVHVQENLSTDNSNSKRKKLYVKTSNDSATSGGEQNPKKAKIATTVRSVKKFQNNGNI